MPEIMVKLGPKVVDTHTFNLDHIRIGRSADNDLVLDHLSVSRHHAEIRCDHGHWVITDLDSANGTYVNGQRITKVPLYHSDTVTVGKLHLHFFDTPAEPQDQRIHPLDSEQTMLLTVPPPPKGCLTITHGRQRGREFPLEKDRTLIGRASDCDVQLSDWLVSKHHAQVVRRGSRFVIEDLGSWRAILINGLPVKESALNDGDTIQLGSTRLSFTLLTPEGPAGARRERVGRSDSPTESNEQGYRLAIATAAELALSEPRAAPLPRSAAGASAPHATPVPLAAVAQPEEPQGHNGTGGEESAGHVAPEVAMWMQALKSERPALRRHAARQLEKLTGKRYDV